MSAAPNEAGHSGSMPAYAVSYLRKTTVTILAPTAKEAGKVVTAQLREGDVIVSTVPITDKGPTNGDSPSIQKAEPSAPSSAA